MNIHKNDKKTKIFNSDLPLSREDVEEDLVDLIGQGSTNPYFNGMTKGYNQEETIIGLNYWYDKGVRMGITLRENPTNIEQLWQLEIDKLTLIDSLLEEE